MRHPVAGMKLDRKTQEQIFKERRGVIRIVFLPESLSRPRPTAVNTITLPCSGVNT